MRSDITSVRCEASSLVIRGHHRQLDASVGASGPHDFAVRSSITRLLMPQRPPHPALNVRDDAYAPLIEAGRRDIVVILARSQTKNFSPWDWTLICPTGGPIFRTCAPGTSRNWRRRQRILVVIFAACVGSSINVPDARLSPARHELLTNPELTTY